MWNIMEKLMSNYLTGSYITKDYLADLHKHTYLDTGLISNVYNSGTSLSSRQIDDLFKSQLKDYVDEYIAKQLQTSPFGASTSSTAIQTAQTTSQVSLLQKYPITNHAYKLVTKFDELPDELYELYQNQTGVFTHLCNVPFSTQDVFVAKLEQTRFKQEDITEKMAKIGVGYGNTCDPWFRNISLNRDKFKMQADDKEELAWLGQHQYQLKILANSEELIMFWGIKSTIKAKIIYLLLYTIFEMGYISKNRKTNHLTMIAPYNCSVAPNYDCF